MMAGIAKSLRTISMPPQQADLKVGPTPDIEADLFRSASRPLLEIQLRADLDETVDHHNLRHAVCAVGRAFREDRARIQRVVHVEIHCRAARSELEDFADTEIKLIDAVAVERARGGR